MLVAFGSGGDPSEYEAAMSACSAPSASSSVSVAEHMANKKPPSSTYWRSRRATPFLRSGTLPNPSRSAISSFRDTSSWSQGDPAYVRKNLEYCPVKSSWCRCSHSYSSSRPSMTSSSQMVSYGIWAYVSAMVTASSQGVLLGGV